MIFNFFPSFVDVEKKSYINQLKLNSLEIISSSTYKKAQINQAVLNASVEVKE